MGLQLIFVVETNKKSKSDWIYVKDTVDYFTNMNELRLNLVLYIWKVEENIIVLKTKRNRTENFTV